MRRYECKIKGLDCADCANKIQEELSKNTHLQNVSVSFAKQKIIYETKDVTRDEIEKIVKSLEPEVEFIDDDAVTYEHTDNQQTKADYIPSKAYTPKL